MANFGWEYVWHCHILSHEEKDMMRSIAFAVPPMAPTGLTATANVSGTAVTLAWTNPSVNASGFTVERATDAGFTTGLTKTPLGLVTTFADNTVLPSTAYFYRVVANNTVGSSVPGYPTLTADSQPSNIASVAPPSMVVVSPTSLAFGDQLVGANSSVRTVAVTNIGTTPVTLVSVTFTGPFSRSGGSCNGSILAGATCTIGVRSGPSPAARRLASSASPAPIRAARTPSRSTATASRRSHRWRRRRSSSARR